ncbi:C2H2-type zinc finger protein [Halobacterium zhouii]
MSSDQHECDMCGATFDTEEQLQEHNEEQHSDQM